MEQSHNEIGNEANEFGNELVKSGSDDWSNAHWILKNGAERSESGNVDERDDVMQLG